MENFSSPGRHPSRLDSGSLSRQPRGCLHINHHRMPDPFVKEVCREHTCRAHLFIRRNIYGLLIHELLLDDLYDACCWQKALRPQGGLALVKAHKHHSGQALDLRGDMLFNN